ncbi:METTL9 [Bugula neritina]|uniref:METTL9 n=1 Tax=Bugula neritina TaxID=10212 RepID=A0A7J7J154_BUGNE|nr:METTL9 [Bugula neritina]
MRRSRLTEVMLEKQQLDLQHRNDNHFYWYQIRMDEIDETERSKFVQLNQDEQTQNFLDTCYNKSDAFLLQFWHALAVPVLKMFMTQTNVNGYLDRGSMFVFSSAQFRSLMSIEDDWVGDSLLDLGAGDGKVTDVMASHFQRIYVTEIATQMQKQLIRKKYNLLGLTEWTHHKFEVISCLNLLDRCDKPLTLLQNIRQSVKENGRVIVASVYPYSPYVEENSSSNYKPSESLDITASSIEEQINLMVKNVFTPSGFELLTFSRVPYLCEGDLTTSFYILYDIVFVLQPSKQNKS